MKQYLEILQEILDKGSWKEAARENMPRTISRFSVEKRFDLQEGFPLITTKKMYINGIIHELIWFLKGDTNIKYLVDNNVNIWNQDAYKYYLKKCKENNFETKVDLENFIKSIKSLHKNDFNYLKYSTYIFGDLGPIYGKQWRKWTGTNDGNYLETVDQIQNLIKGLNKNPYSRYHIVTAWNPSQIFNAALPPCHMLFQFNCRKMNLDERMKYRQYTNGYKWDDDNQSQYFLDCKMIQRSCDVFLGVPFNIASYALLTHIIAKMVNMVPGEFIWSGNDVHIYENHLPQVKEQLSREPKKLSKLNIKVDQWNSIDDIKFEDFEILNYESWPSIKAELNVGL